MPSIEFHYHNITSELTFQWFKHNIMCAANPWICEKDRNDANGGKGSERKKNKPGGGGGKKSRRKQKSVSKSQVLHKKKIFNTYIN